MLDAAVDTIAASSGTVTSGASAQLLTANTERNGVTITSDPSGTGTVYLLLAAAGPASATAFHIALAPGGNWDGRVSDVLYRGAIQCFGTGAKIGVVEV